MSEQRPLHIETYHRSEAFCASHDPRAVEVAALVEAAVVDRMPVMRVEHVGSTAVPGCAGKGIVDLAALYPKGNLEAARGLIDDLGFQRQSHRDPFPED